MREIKFRAWNFETHTMVVPVQMSNFIPMDGDYFHYMQFTGLKDKDGKDIYEGDIVQLSINDEKPTHVGKVEYLPPKFFVLDGTKSGLLLTDKYEVIGNLYENPELL